MTDAATTLDALRRGDLAGARSLRLPGLAEFPPEIFGLADTLEWLDIGGGRLTSLPDGMGRLHRLSVLFCSGNRFDRLPPSLGDCSSLGQLGFRATGMREVPGEALPPQLRWLTLTDNRLSALPAALGERPYLQKLMLAGNQLTGLPDSLAGAAALELVRLSANRFASLPGWLPGLPSLAWAAWAGNPCEPAPAKADDAPRVPWSELTLGSLLGEGASGRVHEATRRSGERSAVKLFRGAMTSDGLPAREMAACLAAGRHPNLVGGLGRVVDHPDGADALLVPRVPDGWRVLAGPPSPESCSRDVYDPALRFGPDAALRLARGMASAAAHLHARGLSHGDLYAHNILWDGSAGAAVLGDFGAASTLPVGREGEAWQRVEVRAWGLLLGEVLDRVDCGLASVPELRALEVACTRPEVAARPLMTEVAAALESLAPGS